jgi:hypothetical protein
LYDYADDDSINLIDSMGLSTITLTGMADTSFTGDLSQQLEDAAAALRAILGKCCKKYHLQCDTTVATQISSKRPKVPDGGYNYSNLRQLTGGGNNVIFTDSGLPESAPGLSGAGLGVVIRNGHGGKDLPHELGHDSGYSAPPGYEAVVDGKKQWWHNKVRSNVMNPYEGGDDPDRCYCEKISRLGK